MVQLGNIKYSVDIADLLVRQGEHRAALTLLLIAISASSSKMFPEGTESIDCPAVKPGKTNPMGDKEKFIRFLGPRLRIAMGFIGIPEDGRHKELFEFSAEFPRPEEYIYKECRCPQIHEAGLPDAIRFVANNETDLGPLSITLDLKEGFSFNSGFLSLLRWSVVEAPINGVEFGKKHFRATSDAFASVEDFTEKKSSTLGVSPGRITLIFQLLSELKSINSHLNDEEFKASFIKKLESRKDAAFTLSSTGSPIIRDGKVTNTGLNLVDEIFKNFNFVDIAS
ncbi:MULTISPECIES: hypothetical protein [Klebsiella]|uniref:hypothetical protein n=1 Tax=Klebsiella TaxID=570 RepID=UPI0006651B47|nr:MULTISPECIES: hypothetical protein [Klebsiella]MEC6162230.1 hypothetical protein [Klebsiella grimontii]UHC97310.1 hypothetical protein LUW96_16365 [Klebsiella pasteurii]